MGQRSEPVLYEKSPALRPFSLASAVYRSILGAVDHAGKAVLAALFKDNERRAVYKVRRARRGKGHEGDVGALRGHQRAGQGGVGGRRVCGGTFVGCRHQHVVAQGPVVGSVKDARCGLLGGFARGPRRRGRVEFLVAGRGLLVGARRAGGSLGVARAIRSCRHIRGSGAARAVRIARTIRSGRCIRGVGLARSAVLRGRRRVGQLLGHRVGDAAGGRGVLRHGGERLGPVVVVVVRRRVADIILAQGDARPLQGVLIPPQPKLGGYVAVAAGDHPHPPVPQVQQVAHHFSAGPVIVHQHMGDVHLGVVFRALHDGIALGVGDEPAAAQLRGHQDGPVGLTPG